jgi:hypothetical protein
MSRLHPIFILLILQVSVFGCAQEVQDPLLKEVIEVAENRIGGLDIRGRVVSADGQPLQDVTVMYFFREFGDVLTRKDIDRKRIKIDGDFRIKKRNVSSANFWITKEGFYSEQWSFVFDEDTPRENPGGLERIDLEIVLLEEPSPAPLVRYEGTLRTSAMGPLSVVFSKKRLLPRMGREKEEEILKDFSWPNIYLAVAEAADGTVDSNSYIPEGKKRPIEILSKGWVRLSQPDTGDGFIVFDPGAIPFREQQAFRGMLDAPDDGYAPELEIPAPGSPRKIFFYCRIHGQYGKGMVGGRPPIVIKDGDNEMAVAAITVFLNPTGSRDVRFVHN